MIEKFNDLRSAQDAKNRQFMKSRSVVNFESGRSVSLSDLNSANRKAEVNLLLGSLMAAADDKGLVPVMLTYTLAPVSNHRWSDHAVSAEYFLSTASRQKSFLFT